MFLLSIQLKSTSRFKHIHGLMCNGGRVNRPFMLALIIYDFLRKKTPIIIYLLTDLNTYIHPIIKINNLALLNIQHHLFKWWQIQQGHRKAEHLSRNEILGAQGMNYLGYTYNLSDIFVFLKPLLIKIFVYFYPHARLGVFMGEVIFLSDWTIDPQNTPSMF